MSTDLKTQFANRILFALLKVSAARYWRNTKRMKEIQEQYLMNLLKANANTVFGEERNFNNINSIEDYQKFVPLSHYDDYKKHLELISTGRRNILTKEHVTNFSLSSGSAAASKLIPNTKSLLKEFDQCINVWLFDLYCRFPQLLNGKAFWIITPTIKKETQQSKVKTGFENDSEYFSPLKRWFIRQIFAVPDDIPKLCTGDNYYFMLGVFLLKERNLRLVSVWNPSVLVILLEKILLYHKEIIHSIDTGELNFPEAQDTSSVKILNRLLKPDKYRAHELKEVFSSNDPGSAIWKSVWPNLTLISAWDSAWARYPAQQLQKLFPHVAFQGKGLLATEACITFPVYRESEVYRFVPAYTSHFFEFQNISTSKIRLLHELNQGETYEVIVTMGAGFYRYRLFDQVTCSGYFGDLPVLEFCGKTDIISDIAGEKLHEAHVQQVIEAIFKEMDIIPGLFFLTPTHQQGKYGYCLYLQTESSVDFKILTDRLEEGLCQNFHYQHCRNLQQLLPATIRIMTDSEAQLTIERILADKKIGTTKFSVLRKELD